MTLSGDNLPVATTDRRRMTLDEFLALPDQKPGLELEPDGVVVQKMSPTGRHTFLQLALCDLINGFAMPKRLALALSELRTIFAGAAYLPDVSVYCWHRIPRDARGRVADDYFREPPDIAVEVRSPGQAINALVRRATWYVDNGVRVALVVDPEDESVLVFRQGRQVQAAHGSDAIDIADVLPGFELRAEQVFAPLRLDP